jgi:hypothetical protein
LVLKGCIVPPKVGSDGEKDWRFALNGDMAVGVVVVKGAGGMIWPVAASGGSNLVIARPLGTPLAFLFFDDGPVDGEVWRDKVRGVIVAEATCEGSISEAF